MSLVTLKELVDNPNFIVNNAGYHFTLTRGTSIEERSQELLDKLKEYVLTYGYYQSKALRPWIILPDYFNRLDATQSWMGFEFESDWRSEEARRDAVSWVWDNIYGCCFDPEGSNGYSTEITLPPQEVSRFEAGEADFQKMMQHLCSLDDRGLGGSTMSGTHLNFSTPAIRTNSNLCGTVAFMLNNSMSKLLPEQRAELFARSPTYGGAFNQGTYIEMKVFRSTYSYEQFQQYVQRGLSIIKLVEKFTESLTAAKTQRSCETECCANFYEVVANGAEPVFTTITSAALQDLARGTNVPSCHPAGEDEEYWRTTTFDITDINYELDPENYDDDDYYDDEYDEVSTDEFCPPGTCSTCDANRLALGED